MASKIIKTPHGVLKTPLFMPDATRGFIKLLSNDELNKVGVEAMVVNTFHLYLQPGLKIIKKIGGIHNFMNWQKPLLSDSGGFQVFSLVHKNKNMGKIYDDRVVFRSPLDGSKHELTPEKSIQIQFDLGVDMMVCLDDCPPNNYSNEEIAKSVERTIVWAGRCAREYERQIKKRKIKEEKRPLIFSVIQGGAEFDLRKKCLEGLMEVAPRLGWSGYGFGARHISEEGVFMEEIMQRTADLIPADALRFALGVGTPDDIARSVKLGWDMFDCVIPTREGRHGRLFTSPPAPLLIRRGEASDSEAGRGQVLNIKNAKFKNDFSAINKNSKLSELRENTKAYLHHLFKLNEPLGQKFASLNNLEFYINFVNKLRK
ncbi:MAG: tRNA guanosine(34) transglycosylase Tgt [Patescibacteria group bacterium]|nr:tRNA guanosine(34) transglycosylase Tgt [Patescibacteria group bacterium]MDD4610850.1 tRNA guanosine(34) transglycosylase Tgt [Patescibacteria group bacterium]